MKERVEEVREEIVEERNIAFDEDRDWHEGMQVVFAVMLDANNAGKYMITRLSLLLLI